jgi:hypothetical protein
MTHDCMQGIKRGIIEAMAVMFAGVLLSRNLSICQEPDNALSLEDRQPRC